MKYHNYHFYVQLMYINLFLGIGCGIAFMPGSVAVAKYFKNRRHLALAISSAGGGVGSFAFPPIIEMLNEQYTWRGMFLILGGISLNIVAFGALFRPLEQEGELGENSLEKEYSSEQSKLQHDDKETTEQLLPKGHKSEMVPLDEPKLQHDISDQCGFLSRHSYFKIPSFYMLMLNNFMFQFGASIILGHLQAYAVYELHYTPTNAALLYTISGVMVLVFKLLHGALANIDYVNIFRPIYQYIFFYFVGGIATICLVIKTSYGIYFYSAIFGMSYAACGGSLIPSLIIDLAGVETFGVTYGIVLCCLSIGQLMGGPIAGE
jgi:predicted MFS family arabinose efflux permease